MSEHLPECFYRLATGKFILNPPCICDRLRACEQRKDDECEHHNHDSFMLGKRLGYAEALDKAAAFVRTRDSEDAEQLLRTLEMEKP